MPFIFTNKNPEIEDLREYLAGPKKLEYRIRFVVEFSVISCNQLGSEDYF